MIYIGLGNSGSRILKNLFEYVFPQDLPSALVQGHSDEYRVSDADTNNPVINEIGVRHLHLQPPPQRIDIDSLATYWSGGCGVYHIIGELVADTAMNDEQFRRRIAPFSSVMAQPVTLLLSAGGGTGGGVGGHYLENLAAANIRAVTVLPELIYHPTQPLSISGSDSFQTVSAGRLLTKMLGRIKQIRANPGAAGANPTPHDILLLSNTHLTTIPTGITYPEAFARLNRYLVHTLAFLPSPVVSPPNHRILTTGLGTAVRIPPGGDQPLGVQQLSQHLMRSALGEPLDAKAAWGLDLSRPHPTGLAALPMEASTYSTAVQSLWADGHPVNDFGQKLQRIFRKCLSVEAHLVYRRDVQATPAEILNLKEQVQTDLGVFLGHDVYGGNVEIKVSHGPVATEYVPRIADGKTPADFVLLLLFNDLMIEDVFRLVTYFVESSFPWQDGGIGHIADLIRHILAQRVLGDVRGTLTAAAGNGRPAGNKVHLAPDAREYYAPRFWGNIDDLRNKVLQSLDRQEDDFNGQLLTPDHVANVLRYFHEQLWRYEN